MSVEDREAARLRCRLLATAIGGNLLKWSNQKRWMGKKMSGSFLLILFLISAPLFSGCTGFGVSDAEKRAREIQTQTAESLSPGLSVWSMFGSSKEAVRKRLDPGLGKPKEIHIATFGDPFNCNLTQTGDEVCGWYDSKMNDSQVTDPIQHRVFYIYGKDGKAYQWFYEGQYGKLNSLDPALPKALSPSGKQNGEK